METRQNFLLEGTATCSSLYGHCMDISIAYLVFPDKESKNLTALTGSKIFHIYCIVNQVFKQANSNMNACHKLKRKRRHEALLGLDESSFQLSEMNL